MCANSCLIAMVYTLALSFTILYKVITGQAPFSMSDASRHSTRKIITLATADVLLVTRGVLLVLQGFIVIPFEFKGFLVDTRPVNVTLWRVNIFA